MRRLIIIVIFAAGYAYSMEMPERSLVQSLAMRGNIVYAHNSNGSLYSSELNNSANIYKLSAGKDCCITAFTAVHDNTVYLAINGKEVGIQKIAAYCHEEKNLQQTLYPHGDGDSAPITTMDACNDVVVTGSSCNVALWQPATESRGYIVRTRTLPSAIAKVLIVKNNIFCATHHDGVHCYSRNITYDLNDFDKAASWKKLYFMPTVFSAMAYDDDTNCLYVADDEGRIVRYYLKKHTNFCPIIKDKRYTGTISSMFIRKNCLFVSGSSGIIQAFNIQDRNCITFLNAGNPIVHMLPTDDGILVCVDEGESGHKIYLANKTNNNPLWPQLYERLGVSLLDNAQ